MAGRQDVRLTGRRFDPRTAQSRDGAIASADFSVGGVVSDGVDHVQDESWGAGAVGVSPSGVKLRPDADRSRIAPSWSRASSTRRPATA